MSKSLSASKKVMANYFSELLTDDPLVQQKTQQSPENNVSSKPFKNKRLETLFKNANAKLNIKEDDLATTQDSHKPSSNKEIVETKTVDVAKSAPLTTHKSAANTLIKKPKAYRNGSFQALFFNVAGLTVAVPLIELGGIHNLDKTTSLMGKPDWYKGVMLHRDEKINIVDTALWVMPEKCDEKMKSSLNYQYVIMLNDSNWGLTAENLVDTIVLTENEVKWLDTPNKRPWLAGLVKDKMCALLDVESLIQLLNEGSAIHQDD